MKTLTKWLDTAKEKSGSDYMTAKEMGVTRQCISVARQRASMSDENCAKLANYLNVNPIEIVAGKDVEKKPQNAELWGKWLAAASVILALIATTQAVDINTFSTSLAFTPLYIMRSCIWGWSLSIL